MNGATSFTYYVNNLSMYDIDPRYYDQCCNRSYQMNAMIGGGMSQKMPQVL